MPSKYFDIQARKEELQRKEETDSFGRAATYAELERKIKGFNQLGKNRLEMKWNVYSHFGPPSVVMGLSFGEKIDLGSKRELQDMSEQEIS
jgi:hypothetical protein